MFRLNIPVTKAYKKNANTLVIEGIASDSTIDRENERFSAQAVEKMSNAVNKGLIPIRIEHENKLYSEVGVWTEAKMVDNKMYVKGEIDLDFSLGRDVAALLDKGKTIALSVGGKVIDATIEYVKDLGRMVKTYTEVVLNEISVVKNPSNYNATLSIAKSFNMEKKQETTEATKLIEYYKGFSKALTTEQRDKTPDSEFGYVTTDAEGNKVRKLPMPDKAHVSAAAGAMNGTRGGVGIPAKDKAKVWRKIKSRAKVLGMEVSEITQKTGYVVNVDDIQKGCTKKLDRRIKEVKKAEQIWSEAMDNFAKDCSDIAPVSNYQIQSLQENQLSIQAVTNLVRALQAVDFDDLPKPKALEGEDGWKLIDSLPNECFVLDLLPSKQFPHHNKDFTINIEWLKYQLSDLLSGGYSWMTPKDFNMALNHLFHHYQEAMNKKVTKAEEAQKSNVTPVVEATEDDKEVVGLMQKCHSFYVNKEGNRPQVDGNDLSDREVKKFAEAYRTMMERKRSRHSIGTQMSGMFRTAISPNQSGVGEGHVAVNQVNKEETLDTKDNNMNVVAKNTDEAKDTTSTEVVEAATFGASENNTPESPVEADKPPETTTTEDAKVEETVVEGEPSTETATQVEEVAKSTEETSDSSSAQSEVANEEREAKAEETPAEVTATAEALASEEATTPAEGGEGIVEKGVTPGKPMADHNAKRQAKQDLPNKGGEQYAMSNSLEEQIADLEKALTEAPEVKKDEVKVEEVEDTTEKAKGKKADGMKEDEEKTEEKCNKSTVETLVKFISENLVPMVKNLSADVASLKSSVVKSEEIKKSFDESKREESANFQKSYNDLTATVSKMAQTVDLIAKSAQQRKGYASYTALEKSFTKTDETLSYEEKVNKAMDENPKRTLAEAMTFVKTQK